MARSNPFQVTGDMKVRRAGFDLSHSQLMPMTFGQLYPLAPIEVVPGDVIKLGISSFIRAMPLERPPIGRTKLRTYHFLVPFRILWDKFVEFISGQEDYDPDVPYVPPVMPTMPTPQGGTLIEQNLTRIGTLWDFFGFPTAVAASSVYRPDLTTEYKAQLFPFDAYWMIFNEFFRVPGIQPKMVPDWASDDTAYTWQFYPAFRNHSRDYFTSALPWTQRGAPPALPVFGSASAEFDLEVVDTSSIPASMSIPVAVRLDSGATAGFGLYYPTGGSYVGNPTDRGIAKANLNDMLSANNLVDGTSFSSVDINDLRLAVQTQVFYERQARGGARYVEVIRSHFGVIIPDERLMRPLFIGGTVSDILFSEIPQTSATDGTQYQGNIAGAGVGSDAQFVGKVASKEHGVIMSLACITVDAVYHQGMPRSWTRELQLDYPWPEFVGIGEQEIFNYEIFAETDGDNLLPFGYTGRYNEMRYLPNLVCGLLRPGNNQANWTQARNFDTRPTLSSAFISTAPESGNDGAFMRPFAVTDPNATPPFICHFGRQVEMFRPFPYLAEPSAILGG